ncbi:hypothetical protein SmJEL517_g00461 [Synchytrium microbalum]|uniref:YncI copper-binding domain-containing protein n=1 Tax=Synchytrium microbalum TaxID=1806994 RepID=A0A507CI94_9FUNG|nr:uncharacterized protein SmJEL517_g00461 [Synchytrium microbalum]TPX37405.1 hypothetical protein SmJEL517_g00461 [Synchytrium microbalum]
MKAQEAVILFTIALAGIVNGHVTANPNVGIPATSLITAFRVPHGCGTNGTVSISVSIADGVTSVKPRQLAGWNITLDYRPLVPPVVSEGVTVNTTVSAVTFTTTGVPLDVIYFEDFQIQMKLPAANDSTILYFPTIQACTVGFNNWTQIPVTGQPTPSTPAPSITLKTNGTLALAASSSVKSSANVQKFPAIMAVLIVALMVAFNA